MKGYSIASSALELEPHQQMQFSIIPQDTVFCRNINQCSLRRTDRVIFKIWCLILKMQERTNEFLKFFLLKMGSATDTRHIKTS